MMKKQLSDDFAGNPDMEMDMFSGPSPFIRHGMLVLALLALLLLVFVRKAKWPETLAADCFLSAESGPVELKSPVTGELVALLKEDGDSLRTGDFIAVVDNPSDHQAVLALLNRMKALGVDTSENLSQIRDMVVADNAGNLGELQSSFEKLRYACLDLELMHQQREMVSVGRLDKSRLDGVNQQIVLLSEQINLNEKLSKNSGTLYQREKDLEANGQSTDYELKGYENEMLRNQISVDAQKSLLEDYKRQKIDMTLQMARQEAEYQNARNEVLQNFNLLRSALEVWTKNYLIVSPVKGILKFSKTLQAHVTVQADQVLGVVMPVTMNPVVVLVFNQYKMDEIARSESVKLRFDAYPSTEYGYLEGKIQQVFEVPEKGKFRALVKLNRGLVTNTNRPLRFIYGMEGKADIVLKNDNLLTAVLSRLFNKKEH